MPDAVEAMWQDMEQEAADELMWRERHDALPLRTIAAVVFVAEGDAGLVERDQTPVRNGDPVGVARKIREHGLGAGERRSGIDHPSLLPDPGDLTQETVAVSETGLGGTIAGSFSSQDIGDLERGAQAASAVGILAPHQRHQVLERTGHRADRFGRDARVERGRIEPAVPQQDLDHADIDILFQQMGGEAVAQRMG